MSHLKSKIPITELPEHHSCAKPTPPFFPIPSQSIAILLFWLAQIKALMCSLSPLFLIPLLSAHSFDSFLNVCHCCRLDLGFPPKAHVLNAWSPAGAIGRWWRVKRWLSSRFSDYWGISLKRIIGAYQFLFWSLLPSHQEASCFAILHTPHHDFCLA
jgi:hypothetical protein